MAERLTAELTPLSRNAAPRAVDLLGQAEARFRRIVEAFRDRLGRNVREATGVTISPAAWEARPPDVKVVPVAVARAFMTNWELLWWMLPMALVGGLFRRHVIGLVPWEVEKKLRGSPGSEAGAADAAAADLERRPAPGWTPSWPRSTGCWRDGRARRTPSARRSGGWTKRRAR